MTQLALDFGNQRWEERRARFRPLGERIDPREYEVAELAGDGSDTTARAFVEAHHYSGSYPSAKYRVCLYRRGSLVGAAVFSTPCRPEVVTNVFPGGDIDRLLELGRFVLLDEVAGNGESWFLARAFAILRDRVDGVVSFSDPMPRRTAAGALVMPGHVGVIYQAANARYRGRSKGETLHLLPDGRAIHRRALAKIKNGERGGRGTVERLVSFGAAPLELERAPLADRRRWLETWMPRITRPFAHPGNHRYAWTLNRAVRIPHGPDPARPRAVDREAA